MNSSKRRFALIAGTVAAVMVGTGIGVAYWTTTSPPAPGSATAGTAAQVTIEQVGTITGLAPGGGTRPIDIRINNTATFPQRVTEVQITIDSITLAGSFPGGDADGDCDASEFAISPSPNPKLLSPATTIPGLGFADFSGVNAPATISLTDTNENQNACQGATVNLLLEVVG